MARKRPYTQRGLGRVPCTRCGAPSRYQWNICALNNLWHGICAGCDVEFNELVLGFMNVPDWREKAAEYKERVAAEK